VQEQVSRRRPVAPIVAATLGLLLCGLALQLAFFGDGGHAALSDLPRVLLHRQITPDQPPYLVRPLEYPVLSGLLLYAADLVWPTALGALLVTAVAAGACCAMLAVRLARRFGSRAWRWALAMPLVLYSFQNWDVFAITALVLGLFAFEARHYRASGVALGVGGGIKLFPLVVVPVLAAILWAKGRREEARRLLVSATATFVIVNLPVAVLAPSGWGWTYQFQSARQATWGSAWFYIFRLLHLPVHGATGAHLANLVSLAALVAGVAWLVWHVLRHETDAFAAAAAAVAIFLLANKVYSPTYDIWLVAFFVMVPFSRRLWLTFCTVDLAIFITVYGYFHHLHTAAAVRTALPLFVAIRTATLVVIVAHATRHVRARHHLPLAAPPTSPPLPIGENAR
jgi:uncharacterized membrane protein